MQDVAANKDAFAHRRGMVSASPVVTPLGGARATCAPGDLLMKPKTLLAVIAGSALMCACSAAPKQEANPRTLDSQSAARNPCTGRGELFQQGEPDRNVMPAGATVTRRVQQRGWSGVCYTTPESVARAAAN
jgi:hypothetical protein